MEVERPIEMSAKICRTSRRHVPQDRPNNDSQSHDDFNYRGSILVFVVGWVSTLECIIARTESCSYISVSFLQEGVLIHANLRHTDSLMRRPNGIFLMPAAVCNLYSKQHSAVCWHFIPVERVPSSEFLFLKWPSSYSNTEIISYFVLHI